MSNPGTILLCAGGTGGHLFPAESLAGEMQNRGWIVHLVTDDRANRLAGRFPATGVHVVQSATIAARNPLALARTAFTLFGGFRAAQRLLRQIKPDLAIGFGGYPTLPPMLAASRARIPTMIQEQNAVMGRANRFLAARVDAIAGGFLRPESAGPHGGKVVVTGNPVRPAVLEAAKTPYESPTPTGEFRLLVFGGSQGATYFSHVVPDAVGRLQEELRRRLTIVQQAREEDCRTVTEAYDKLGIKAEVEPFFKNMPERMSQAHMVISRSGASTVSELAVIGRPAILVPFPHALDHDQAANAAALEAKGGALLRPQSGMSGSDLVVIMQSLMEDPDRLTKMASAAKAAGHPEATRLLADQAEAITGRPNPTPSGPAQDLKRPASIHSAIKS